MNQFNNIDVTQLKKFLSTMDKDKLEQNIIQINQILSTEDKHKIYKLFNQNINLNQ